MLLFKFKAEVDIQYRLHKVASCLPADSAEINTNTKWVPVKQHTCQPIQLTSIKYIFSLSLFWGDMATLKNGYRKT